MKITLIRHATCLIEFENTRLLLDPIFYNKGTLSPANGGKMINNPLVDMETKDIDLSIIDAILLTHPHRDHFDEKVIEIYGDNVKIICPSHFKEAISDLGFSNILSVDDAIEFKGIRIKLTNARHGIGEIESVMGKSFGFILDSSNEDKLYITGDTVWCDEIKAILDNEKPEYILAFSGNAILNGNKITMGKYDIEQILTNSTNSIVLPIHLEAWNHCILERQELSNLSSRIKVLNNSESITLRKNKVAAPRFS